MAKHRNHIPKDIAALLRRGTVIPAHPLALDADRRFDARRQRALTRYYLDAGAGGLAVGVHATQFAIREAGLYEQVLELASLTIDDWVKHPVVKIGGLAGSTQQAVEEAKTAVRLGYHAGLLSLAALREADEDTLIAHCRHVADEIPLIGFYLQPAVGGMRLGSEFWRRFAEIDNVIAIKAAPFNRYATLDVVRGVVEARAEDRVTIYTGNDDHILLDLLAPFSVMRDGMEIRVRAKGGLLGHWSVWTKSAVELLARIHTAIKTESIDADLLAMDSKITDCNSAIFDVANNFAGCIPGCHEILRRQGLLDGIWCLDLDETLSPGQADAIDRVSAAWPELSDDDFVAKNLERWLS
jgi:hypothetical protein